MRLASGSLMPGDIVRAVMVLRANVLIRPTSGVRPELVEALVALINSGLVPAVPEQGSVGASGDLAPLSHIALTLMGEGQLADGRAGEGRPGGGRPGPVPVRPQGGAFRSSTARRRRPPCCRCWCTTPSCYGAPSVGATAMSLEALRGTPVPLDPRIHANRPHAGQVAAAQLMRELLRRQRDP